VIMLFVELVIVSVTVTVDVAELVVVEYCSTVVAGERFLDGMKAKPTARARRQTVVRIRASCRFMQVPPFNSTQTPRLELSLRKKAQTLHEHVNCEC